MKNVLLALLLGLVLTGPAGAAEKPKAARQLDAARAAVAEVVGKHKDNKLVANDLEVVKALLKRAEESMEKGQQWWLGAGEVKPETEQEMQHLSTMIDLALVQVASRVERARKEDELATLGKQLATVKARLKIFDDRQAEMTRLRSEVTRLEALAKDLAVVQADKTQLAAQVQQLLLEKGEAEKAKEEKKLTDAKLMELTVLNAKLAEQVQKLTEAKQVTPAVPEQKKVEQKEAAPPAAAPAATPASLPQESAPVPLTPPPAPEPAKSPAPASEAAAPAAKAAQ